MKRKRIVESAPIDIDVIEGSLINTIGILQGLVENHGATSRFRLEYGHYDDYDVHIMFEYDRPETDQEYNKRVAKQKKSAEARKRAKKAQEERELKELDRLLKKHGAKHRVGNKVLMSINEVE